MQTLMEQQQTVNQCVDGAAGQGFVLGVQPDDGFLIAETGVLQHHEGALEGFQHARTVQEQRGTLAHVGFGVAQGDERTVRNQVVHAGHLQIEGLRNIGNSDPIADEGEGLSNIFVSHLLRVPELARIYHF